MKPPVWHVCTDASGSAAADPSADTAEMATVTLAGPDVAHTPLLLTPGTEAPMTRPAMSKLMWNAEPHGRERGREGHDTSGVTGLCGP